LGRIAKWDGILTIGDILPISSEIPQQIVILCNRKNKAREPLINPEIDRLPIIKKVRPLKCITVQQSHLLAINIETGKRESIGAGTIIKEIEY